MHTADEFAVFFKDRAREWKRQVLSLSALVKPL